MKKIAIVHDVMLLGGTEISLIEFLNHIDYQKCNVTLFLKNATGPLNDRIHKSVSVRYWDTLDTKTTLRQQLKEGQFFRFLKGVFYRILARLYSKDWDKNTLYSTKCLPDCSDEYYDCVVAYNGVSSSVIATCLYRLKGWKKVVWIHGDGVFFNDRTMEKEYNRFDAGCFVSDSIAQAFYARYPKARISRHIIHNIIDRNKLKKDASAELTAPLLNNAILTVGRLSVEKGQDMIPAATRILVDSGYDVHWYLVGEGPTKKKIEAEVREYRVENHVFLLGALENPYPYMKNCDIYVQTSLSEGWGLTVQEAKILHKPIVVTPVPAMREQIRHNENGLVAQDISPCALAEAIKILLSDSELSYKLCGVLATEGLDNACELQKFYEIIES